MGIAYRKQKLQDWLTQQWVILFGQKVNTVKHQWLLGPFGNTQGIGLKYVRHLAISEGLIIDKKQNNKGLITSINQLNFPERYLKVLSPDVVDFYQNTSNYNLDLKIEWNPFFKVFGTLFKLIFSNRIEQLNIPTESLEEGEKLTSEIIQLKDPETNKVKRTIWLRTFESTNQIVYSGVYETCIIPSGKTCIKAIFPLPKGNATVILMPTVGKDSELILESSGKTLGDSGFYFLLEDSKGQLWTKYIKSFKDTLVVKSKKGRIVATQTLTLWKFKVLTFNYTIKKIQY